jgi:hypothetical protein
MEFGKLRDEEYVEEFQFQALAGKWKQGQRGNKHLEGS